MNTNRFKFRVWWEQEKRYRIDTKIHPIEKFFQKGFIIEQCTGLKDKNGNLIYEGDLLHKKNDKGYMLVYKVLWSEVECGWAIESIEGARALNVFDCDEAVIIGNIHGTKRDQQ